VKLLLMALVIAGASCSRNPSAVATTPAAAGAATLAGSNWHLVEFRSSDDAIGVVRPDDPAKYTMSLAADGRVAMRLDCNRANGPWSSKATSADSGSFSFGNLAMTRALCPPPSLDQQIARDTAFVRSYLLRSGNLYLNLMADGGTYVWSPDAGTGTRRSLGDGGLRATSDTPRDRASVPH
jgi:heat shock protein HslJ